MQDFQTVKEISTFFGSGINSDVRISGISYDSRQVKQGDIFVCLVGEKTDGHNYVKEAESKGAVAFFAEKKLDTLLPVIYVNDTQSAISKLASFFHKEPSRKIKIIGITGTNGKTTTTHLVQHILEKHGLKTAVVGTLGTRETSNSDYYDAKHTTPQAPELQKQLKILCEKKFTHLAMEVSSHALSLHRVDECNFIGAVLTNITQDHLDFHLTMEEYANSKKKLFEMLSISKWDKKFAVINKDDKAFNDFKKAVNAGVKLISYGVSEKADFQAIDISFSGQGLSFTLLASGDKYLVKSQLNGMFNVYNILASIAVAYAEGLDITSIVDSLKDAKEVPGRFQIIHEEKKPMCIVDYAHTPDGLKNILTAAKLMLKDGSKLICVFGCGGDRDPTKRSKMAKIAEELSDFVVITSDNPRSEDPNQIINDILSGIKNTSNVAVEADRKNAIPIAIQKANKSDIVVIAGKGHEDYQILKDETIHFDDREEVKRALENWSSLQVK